MNYQFPTIEHLDQVLEAIEGRTEFVVAERDYFTVIDYQVCLLDTFPADNTMRRECRGIKFYPDGSVAARPYHKFFNLGEKDETQAHAVNFSQDFDILEKLDGSMIHPIITPQGEVAFCTRMGITDVAYRAATHAAKEPFEYPVDGAYYLDFSWDLLKRGITPIFEWCSSSAVDRIVIKHKKDALVLTAIRVNKTGEYLTRGKMRALAEPYRIPMVDTWKGTFDGINEFTETVKEQVDEEGYVIRFHTGHMLKIKNLWYLQIHKAKDHIMFEKNVIELLLDGNEDDVMPHLLEDDAARLKEYKEDLWKSIRESAEAVVQVVDIAKEFTDATGMEEREAKKFFAQNNVAHYKDDLSIYKGILFQVWDGKDPGEVVIETIRKNLGSQTKVDNMRRLLPEKPWDEY